MSKRSPTAIIEVQGCDSASMNGTVQLHHVHFRRNRLRASAMISMLAPSCSALVMNEVRFSNNECNGICGAYMSIKNTLKNITVQNNKNNIDNDAPVMLYAPDGSNTTAEDIVAVSNTGTVLHVVTNASLEISESIFFRNARGESYGDVAPRSVPFDAIPFSASIHLFEASARIWNSRFVGNSGVYGPAVVVVESNLTLFNSTMEDNMGSRGGVVYVKSSMVNITNTSFSGNKALDNGGVGRVIYSEMDIKGCTFHKNRAELEGGTFFVSRSTILCRGTTFSENSASEGGAFFFTAPSEFLIFESNLSANSAETGGALSLYRGSRGIVQDSTFFRNTAESSGSFCHANIDTTLFVNYCQIAENTATALFVTRDSTVEIQHSNFTSNVADGISGGAIFCSFNCTLLMNHTTFTKNKALTGGAFAMAELSLGEIENCRFENNVADTDGGVGHLDEGSNATVNSSTFHMNEAPRGAGLQLMAHSNMVVRYSDFFNGASDSGAAIHALENCFVGIHHSLFENNSVTERGGAIEITSGHCAMLHCIFQGNRAERSGGAVFLASSTLTSSDISFHRNAARTVGGAIHASYDTSLNMNHTIFSNNQASKGGSLDVANSVATIKFSQFINETADGQDSSTGGAIYALRSKLNIQHVKMAANRAVHGADLSAEQAEVTMVNYSTTMGFAAEEGGSIKAVEDSTVNLSNASFTRARAKKTGGAILLQRSRLRGTEINITDCQARHGGAIYAATSVSVLCSNCTFENNTADDQGGGVYLSSELPQSVAFQFENCRFAGNEADRGGAMHVLGEDRIINCTDPRADCTFVALSGTIFTHNRAHVAGGAVLASDLNMIHLNCTAKESNTEPEFFDRFGDLQYMDVLNHFNSVCPDWTGNEAGVYGDVIGSYASRLKKWLQDGQSNSTVEIIGNRYRIEDHQSGFLIPIVFLQMVDALDQGPVTGIGNKPISAVMQSPDGLFTGELKLELEGGAGNFSGVAGYVRPGDYDVKISFDQRNLPQLILTIEIRNCTIGESIAANGTYCQPCSGDTYNFFPEDAGCVACPENGKCDSVAIRPRPGYWHPIPCATHVQECLTERACDSGDRDEKLKEVVSGMKDCNFSSTFVKDYQVALCRKVSRGGHLSLVIDGWCL